MTNQDARVHDFPSSNVVTGVGIEALSVPARTTPTVKAPGGFVDEFAALHRATYQTAFKLLGDRHEAEDIAQEACARACLRWRRLDNPEAWSVRVASNLAIDRWRRTQRENVHTRTDDTVAPDDGVRIDLYRALAQLPRRQRETVVLRYIADLTEQQTAAALGCKPGTVKTHAARGLQALRATLDVPEED
jgi:RNA polymerase sigma-70 factor (sigma-E family)